MQQAKRKMNRRHFWGVTLLEMMLVLAIAAEIVILSMKYYQGAVTQSQVNATLNLFQTIKTTVDNMTAGGISYLDPSMAQANVLAAIGPAAQLPWSGSSVTIAFLTWFTAPIYEVQIANVPAGVCNIVAAKLRLNNHMWGVIPYWNTPKTKCDSLLYQYHQYPLR